MRSTSSLLVLAGLVLAGPIIRPQATTSWLWLRATHDDNVFRYSPADLGSFRQSRNPARFPFRTADDLDLTLSWGWTTRYRLGFGPGSVTLRGVMHQFVSNREKSYGLVEAGLSQQVVGRGRAECSLLWMPSYLIRYYRDPRAGTRYTACRYTEYLASVGFRQPLCRRTARSWESLGRFLVIPSYRHEWDDYQAPFDYYDTRAHRFGARLEFEPVPNLELDARYERKLARAKGPVPDISYNQHELGGALLVRHEATKLSFSVGYEFSRRDYTTTNPEDKSHYGREDGIESLKLEAGYRLGRTRLVAGYEIERRETSSVASEEIEDVKQYRQNRVNVGVRFGAGSLLSRSAE